MTSIETLYPDTAPEYRADFNRLIRGAEQPDRLLEAAVVNFASHHKIRETLIVLEAARTLASAKGRRLGFADFEQAFVDRYGRQHLNQLQPPVRTAGRPVDLTPNFTVRGGGPIWGESAPGPVDLTPDITVTSGLGLK